MPKVSRNIWCLDIQKIQKSDTVIVTDSVSAGKIQVNVRVVKPVDRLNINSIEVEVIASCNVNTN